MPCGSVFGRFCVKSMEIHRILWWILVVIRIMLVIRIMGVVDIIGVMDPWAVDLWTMGHGLTDYGPWDYVLWDYVLWHWYGSMFKCKVFYVRWSNRDVYQVGGAAYLF